MKGIFIPCAFQIEQWSFSQVKIKLVLILCYFYDISCFYVHFLFCVI